MTLEDEIAASLLVAGSPGLAFEDLMADVSYQGPASGFDRVLDRMRGKGSIRLLFGRWRLVSAPKAPVQAMAPPPEMVALEMAEYLDRLAGQFDGMAADLKRIRDFVLDRAEDRVGQTK